MSGNGVRAAQHDASPHESSPGETPRQDPTSSQVGPPRAHVLGSQSNIFQVVRAALLAEIGPRGTWTLARRTESDSTGLFDELVTASLARRVTAAIEDPAASDSAIAAGTSTSTSVEIKTVASVDDSAAANDVHLPKPLSQEDRVRVLVAELSIFDATDPLAGFVGPLPESDESIEPIRFVA